MLPVADAARFAGPGLDATIERLRFERIALLMRRPEIRARNPFLAQSMRDANFGAHDAFRAGLWNTRMGADSPGPHQAERP